MTPTMKPTPRKPTRRYRAVCYECYTCWLNVQPVSRREANVLAASHMLAYRHHTAVIEVDPRASA